MMNLHELKAQVDSLVSLCANEDEQKNVSVEIISLDGTEYEISHIETDFHSLSIPQSFQIWIEKKDCESENAVEHSHDVWTKDGVVQHFTKK
jgi:hypothetical protein